MLTVNEHQIIGKLGRDPEQRQLSSGGSVINFSIATEQWWKDKSGERQKKTTWHNVVCFNENLGKVIMKHLRKGSKARIVGEIQHREWEDRDGNKRQTTETVMSKYGGTLTLLDGRSDNSGNTSRQDNNRSQGGYDGAGQGYELEDQIPF